MSQTLGGVVRAITARIAARPHADGAREARALLEHVTGLSSASQLSAADEVVSPSMLENIEALVQRREAGEPLARLMGRAAFWDFEVRLNRATLVPRDDTGALVETALERLPRDQAIHVVDAGTGSGIILLALARERPDLQGLGVDLSEEAVEQATVNAANLALSDRVSFVQSNWLDAVKGPVDMVVSNPPYIRQSDMKILAEEVREHDPVLALAAGMDGLEAYRTLLPQAFMKVRAGGHVIVEIGADQKQAVCAIGEAAGWRFEACLPDLSGHDRVIAFHKNRGL